MVLFLVGVQCALLYFNLKDCELVEVTEDLPV